MSINQPEDVDSAATLGHLMRVLRRYSLGPSGVALRDALLEIAAGEREGLVAFDEGSDERRVEGILAFVHQSLGLLVAELGVEIGTTVLDARDALKDIDPDDFAGESW